MAAAVLSDGGIGRGSGPVVHACHGRHGGHQIASWCTARSSRRLACAVSDPVAERGEGGGVELCVLTVPSVLADHLDNVSEADEDRALADRRPAAVLVDEQQPSLAVQLDLTSGGVEGAQVAALLGGR